MFRSRSDVAYRPTDFCPYMLNLLLMCKVGIQATPDQFVKEMLQTC